MSISQQVEFAAAWKGRLTSPTGLHRIWLATEIDEIHKESSGIPFLVDELLKEMRQRGFGLVYLEPEVMNPKKSELLQANEIFTQHDPLR